MNEQVNYENEMVELFGITKFPEYPNTGDPSKDAQEFVGQFREVSLFKQDSVYYTDSTSCITHQYESSSYFQK